MHSNPARRWIDSIEAEHERSVLQLSTSRIDGKVVSGASSCAQMPLPHPHVRAGDEVSGRAWVGDLSPANGGRRRVMYAESCSGSGATKSRSEERRVGKGSG